MTKGLKQRRKALGLSQIDLAKRIGVSLMTVQLWERGVGNPNKENQEKLEQTLKELERGEK